MHHPPEIFVTSVLASALPIEITGQSLCPDAARITAAVASSLSESPSGISTARLRSSPRSASIAAASLTTARTRPISGFASPCKTAREIVCTQPAFDAASNSRVSSSSERESSSAGPAEPAVTRRVCAGPLLAAFSCCAALTRSKCQLNNVSASGRSFGEGTTAPR